MLSRPIYFWHKHGCSAPHSSASWILGLQRLTAQTDWNTEWATRLHPPRWKNVTPFFCYQSTQHGGHLSRGPRALWTSFPWTPYDCRSWLLPRGQDRERPQKPSSMPTLRVGCHLSGWHIYDHIVWSCQLTLLTKARHDSDNSLRLLPLPTELDRRLLPALLHLY